MGFESIWEGRGTSFWGAVGVWGIWWFERPSRKSGFEVRSYFIAVLKYLPWIAIENTLGLKETGLEAQLFKLSLEHDSGVSY